MNNQERQHAHLFLAPYFDAVRDVFAARYPDIRKTRFEVSAAVHDTPRHYAACRDDGLLIQVAPQMVDLEAEHVVAILSHECGHALDFLYPARFKVTQPGHPAREASGGRGSERDLRRWRERELHEVELAADCIAHLVTGRKILYSGECPTSDHCHLLQSFSEGVVRPAWLR